MSARSWSTILYAGVILTSAWTASMAAEKANPRRSTGPLITIDPPTATPVRAVSTQPANVAATGRPTEADGTVGRALTRLYRIPRAPQPAPATAAPRGTAVRPGSPTARTTGQPEPLQRSLVQHDRMGYQHTDAIRNSVSSVPIGDDLRRPQGNGTIVPNQNNGPAVARENSRTAPPWGPYGGTLYNGNDVYANIARHHLPAEERDWVDYRYFDGQPSRYGYGRYNNMYGIGNGGAEGEYFRFGFTEGYDRGQWDRESNERVQSVLSHAGTQMSRGLATFRAGQYREATKYFKLASEMNQGDPSAMIYAAHALFAVGRYQEGSTYLRKAFTLEPRIAMLTYDMRDDYTHKQDFATQLAALQSAVDASPRNIDRLAMLGYVLNYTGQTDRAYNVLAKAHKIDANDKVVKLLYEASNPPDVVK